MSGKNFTIEESILNDDLVKLIFHGFAEHSLAKTGHDGGMQEITLIASHSKSIHGILHGKTFWGGFHIKHLYLIPEARGQGLGRKLMLQAIEKAKTMDCRFAFVETMSFQAVGFYQKLGFKQEFAREGYQQGVTFHYLRKDF